MRIITLKSQNFTKGKYNFCCRVLFPTKGMTLCMFLATKGDIGSISIDLLNSYSKLSMRSSNSLANKLDN